MIEVIGIVYVIVIMAVGVIGIGYGLYTLLKRDDDED